MPMHKMGVKRYRNRLLFEIHKNWSRVLLQEQLVAAYPEGKGRKEKSQYRLIV